MSPHEIEDLVLYQIAAVAGVAQVEGLQLQHVKPHGALYNMAARDASLASAIAKAVAAFNPGLILLGLPGSELLKAGKAAGLRVAGEVFADRAYEPDGTLVTRSRLGSILHDIDKVVARAVGMARDGTVEAIDGSTIHVQADTICVHGDTPGADDLAVRLRGALQAAGILVKPLAAL